jgi:hypothetical protein
MPKRTHARAGPQGLDASLRVGTLRARSLFHLHGEACSSHLFFEQADTSTIVRWIVVEASLVATRTMRSKDRKVIATASVSDHERSRGILEHIRIRCARSLVAQLQC